MYLIAAFFLFVMGGLLVAPAMARPTNRIQCIQFTATQIGIGNMHGPDFVNYVTDNNVQITKDVLGWGMISLWTSPNSDPSSPNLQGSTSSKIDVLTNLNTGKGLIKYEMTWTFDGGTFEGIIVGNLVGPTGNQPPTAYSSPNLYGILKGTGIFEGQTAIFSGTRPLGPTFSWKGTIIIT
jgi:hypothetical protein